MNMNLLVLAVTFSRRVLFVGRPNEGLVFCNCAVFFSFYFFLLDIYFLSSLSGLSPKVCQMLDPNLNLKKNHSDV